MSDTKHTPGPWKWEEGTPTITKEWNGTKVCVAQVKGADLHWHEDRRMASIEAGDNARLIAAAPELLGALKKAERIIQKLAGWSGNDLSELDSEFGYHAIPEAIAKATQP